MNPFVTSSPLLPISEWEYLLLGKKLVRNPSASSGFSFADPDVGEIEFPEQVRFLPPESMVTADYVVERLNVNMNGDGIVVSVAYG